MGNPILTFWYPMKSIYICVLLLTLVNFAQFTSLRRLLSKVQRDNRSLQATIKHFQEKKNFFAAMNAVRTNPKSIIPDLKLRLKWFKGDTMYRPGVSMGLTTNEGPAAILELIKFLKNAKPLPKMRWSNGLSKTCQDFSKWAGPDGVTGHSGPGVVNRCGIVLVRMVNGPAVLVK